ncbi:hypothetical protein VQ7734_03996 [Vibrio quintilis]|uniref:Uncharacterized protein n=1 Tax=Vibrio quintilis TaxID=1117707 RepID=A0A1M7Z0N1_9VIBR|nr:hypothetical protein VQ7734_03996 [Vibrio quintilis]
MEAEPSDEDITGEIAESEAALFDELDDVDFETPDASDDDFPAEVAEAPAVEAEASDEDITGEIAESEAALFDELDDIDFETPDSSDDDFPAEVAEAPAVEAEPSDEDITGEIAESEAALFDELDDIDFETPDSSDDDFPAEVAEAPAVEAEPSDEDITGEIAESEAALFDELDDIDFETPDSSDDDFLAEVAEAPAVEAEPSDEDLVEALQESGTDLAEDDVIISDDELPDFGEEEALEAFSSQDEASEPVVSDDYSFIDDVDLPEFDEQDALSLLAEDDEPKLSAEENNPPEADNESDMLSVSSGQTEASDTEFQSQATVDIETVEQEIPASEFDEETLHQLLTEDEMGASGSYAFDANMDEDTMFSAGMDIDSMLDMGGEDWKGFKLSPEQQASISEDVPEDQKDIWRDDLQVHEPQADKENWAVQDDLAENGSEKRHLSIDELMAQVDAEGGEFDDADFKLDVGLNEFPDVIGEVENIDVDNNSEAAGKLDLAKIYIEMNDNKGAIKLLEQAIVDGNDDIRRAAKQLIDGLSDKR